MVVILAQKGTEADPRPWKAELFKQSPRAYEKELLEELQDVLEKLQNKKMTTWEKKFNQLPKCFIGDVCAVKKGPRIGRLCDCPGGAICNSFLRRCL
ncbi:hypothetical protein NDU88_001160 [Pleurodeles waltl]|uniref:Cocaine- and amphetamine-regulated transcript protein n=1 Tax=Pleurodeles waltl TaxID=8319 RepID=A0AAV7KVG4_PLEWA|nr:hypothetical protein NDU88_001160 [Pleurodeles waltl]